MRHRPEDNERENHNPDRRHDQSAHDRWGQPDPHHNHNERHPDDPHNDWRPFEQRDNRHFQEGGRDLGYDRPQGANFNRNNQHSDDRWHEDRDRPAQRHHPRHASERFYREQRRRHD